MARMVDVDESDENDRSEVEASEQPENETLRMCSSRGFDPLRWPRPLKMGMMAMVVVDMFSAWVWIGCECEWV